MLSAMKRTLSVESFAEPEGSGGSGFSISKRLRTGVRRHVFDKDVQVHTKYVMQDKVERPQFVRKIALSYIVSAALIAVLCLTGQIIVQVYESRTHTDGRYVNTAGKQRYYSQAIAKASLSIERANASSNAASSAHFQSQLQTSLQQWHTAQYGIQNGDPSLHLSGSDDKTIRRLFAQVDPSFQAMYAAGVQILQEVSGSSFAMLGLPPPNAPSNIVGISPNVDVLMANEETFLLLMDEIVGRFQDLGEEHVHTLLIITWIFAGLIILTLVLEGVFLVRPVLLRMHLLVAERFDLLHASLEAEAAARGVSILMVGYVSHEMREPLGSVMRNLKYLFSQLKQMAIIHGKPEGGALHEACKSALETLRQSLNSCRLLATVIDDIVDMRKLEAGMLTLYTKPVDIGECMRHVAGMMQPKLGVTLRTELDPLVEGKRYNLDRHRLEQLLVNLISNAIKFTREGTVVVRVLPWDDRGLRFEVIDMGIGMTSEASAKVFMPFIETPHDKANFQGGTGLGLYICKLLADLMGGTIGVTSEVGHGSTFWFNLPASFVVDHALSSAGSTPRDPPVINGFTTSGALPEGREGEIDEDEKDEDEKELPPLMGSQEDVETTVSGPGHVHHGGVSISSILGNASKPLEELDHASPRTRRGGSLKGGSKFWSLSESSPRRGGSYHGGNTFRGEGSYRGGARRGSSVHGGSVYRGGGGPHHLSIDIEGLSQRGSRGAPSPLGNGGGLVRTLSNTSTPLLAEQGPTFMYHGRPVEAPEVRSFDVETEEGATRGVRVSRESARGGNLFLKLQEKLQAGVGGEKQAPRDASDAV